MRIFSKITLVSRSLICGSLLLLSIGQSNAQDKKGLYESAVMDLKEGRTNYAVIKIKNLLQKDPNNLPARLLFADILLQFGEFSAAEDHYRNAMRLDADKELIVVPLARILLFQGKTKQLLEEIKPTGYSHAVLTQVHIARGEAHMQLGDKEAATAEYEKALVYDPNAQTALIGLAKLALIRNDNSLFTAALSRAKAINPNSSMVWLYQAEAYRQTGKYAEAFSAYESALAINPQNFDVRKNKASLHLDRNELELAEEELSLVLDAVPDDPFALLLKAQLLSKSGNRSEAISILSGLKDKLGVIDKKVLSEFVPLAIVKGITEFLLKNYSEARRSLVPILNRDPRNQSVREILAEIRFIYRDYKGVIEYLESIEPDSMSGHVAEIYANSLLNEGELFELSRFLEKLPPRIQQENTFSRISALVKARLGEDQIDGASEKGLAAEDLRTKESLLISGYNHLQSGKRDKALAVAKTLAKYIGGDVQVLNFVGAAYKANKDLDNAELYYRKALKVAPDDLLVNLNLAQILLAKEQIEGANEIVERQLAKYPDDVRVLSQYSQILLKQNKVEQAADFQSQVNAKLPESQQALLSIISLHLRKKTPELAIEYVRRLENVAPLAPTTLIARAKVSIAIQDYRMASRTLRVLQGLIGDSPEKLQRVIEMLIKAKDYESADKSLRKLRSSSPNYPALAKLQARLFFEQNQSRQAIHLLEKIPESRQTGEELELLSRLYAFNDNLEKAQSFGEKAFEKSQNPSVLPLLTSIYWRLDTSEKAVELLNRWLQDHQEDNGTRSVLANLYQQTNRFNEALKEYEIVLQQKENDIFSLVNTALILTYLERTNEVQPFLDKALTLTENDSVVLGISGWMKLHGESEVEGLALLRESYARDATNGMTLYNLGKVLKAQGRTEEAVEFLEKAIEVEENHFYKGQAKDLLKELRGA